MQLQSWNFPRTWQNFARMQKDIRMTVTDSATNPCELKNDGLHCEFVVHSCSNGIRVSYWVRDTSSQQYTHISNTSCIVGLWWNFSIIPGIITYREHYLFSGVTISGIQFLVVQILPPRIVLYSFYFLLLSFFMCFRFSLFLYISLAFNYAYTYT